MTNAMQLQDKVAVVLGVAPNNLGHAIARRFVAEGARVVVGGRRAEPLAEVAAEIGVVAVPCDITRDDEVDRLVATALERFGRLDVGLNATGWGLLKAFTEHSREDLERMAQVQFIGPFRFFQALIKAMAQGGSIIQISSVTATIMFDHHAAYMGTKAGIDHVIRCIAHEFGHQRIRANSLSPGGIADTPMSGGGLHFPPVAELYNKQIPLGRPGVAADVVNAAVWLASDQSAFVTGQNIQVSGGQTLRTNPRLTEIAAAAGAGSSPHLGF